MKIPQKPSPAPAGGPRSLPAPSTAPLGAPSLTGLLRVPFIPSGHGEVPLLLHRIESCPQQPLQTQGLVFPAPFPFFQSSRDLPSTARQEGAIHKLLLLLQEGFPPGQGSPGHPQLLGLIVGPT